MLGSIVVLAVAAVVVLAGLYLTVYRPAREQVLAVGDQTYTTDEVYRRALYLMLYQQSIAPQSQVEIVSKTLQTLEREETLRVRGKQDVPEVTSEDVTRELQLLLAPPIPPQPSVSVGGASATVTVGTPAPSETPTATPTVDLDEYAKALQQRLERSKLTRHELEAIIAAGLYEDRLLQKFKAEAPKSAPQILLVTARIADQPTAERVRTIGLRPNVDFAQVASQNSISDQRAARAGVPTWTLVEQLEQPTRDIVKGMKAGDISAVTQVGTAYEVYKVVEVSADRELLEDQKESLALSRVLTWLDEEGKQLTMERSLTPQREQWITDRVLKAYAKASGTPSAR